MIGQPKYALYELFAFNWIQIIAVVHFQMARKKRHIVYKIKCEEKLISSIV